MRRLFLLWGLVGLAACNSTQSAKNEANAEYAVQSYEQSLAAYQICVAQNANDPERCAALARVIEADKRRYENGGK
ncbi:MAG: hypothetical protein ACR650_05315 [Methylocystis sp.]